VSITLNVQNPFTPEELKMMDGTRDSKDNPYGAWDLFLEEVDSGLDLSDKQGIKNIADNLLETYAGIHEKKYAGIGAKEHAAYAVQRMVEQMYSGGSDSAMIKTGLTGSDDDKEGFFKLIGRGWYANTPGNETGYGKLVDKNGNPTTGLYGIFTEEAIFGAGASGENKDKRYADLMRKADSLVSHTELKAAGTDLISVGAVTLRLDTVSQNVFRHNLPSDFNTNPKYLNLSPQAHGEMVESARELSMLTREAFADFLVKNKDIANYVIGRTIGVFKLFEKMVSLLVIGIESKSHDSTEAVFKYTSANVYAQLKYKEILDLVKEKHGVVGLGMVNITTSFKKERKKMGLNKEIFGKMDITVKLPNIGEPLDIDGLKLSTAIYKDVFNIFSNSSQKIALFKALYENGYQDGAIATNIEVLKMIEDSKKI